MTNKQSQKSWISKLIQHLSHGDEPTNREELIEMLKEAEQRNLINIDAMNVIEGAIGIGELTVGDIMIPRSHVIAVDVDKPLTELLSIMIESGHSRYPVVKESLDDIKGLLLAKDLLKHYVQHENKPFKLADILRPILKVPESRHLDILLREFRNKHSHLAIVTDEYGNISGLITIEDVLEQIVGDIEDEHDITTEEEKYIRQLAKDEFIIDALTPIEDFNEYFGSHLSDLKFDTIGGLITHQFGHLPKINEIVIIDRFSFKILQGDSRRIHQIQCKVQPN